MGSVKGGQERLVRHRGVQEHETIRCPERAYCRGAQGSNGASSISRPQKRYAEAKNPEVVKRPGGVQVVYVAPALKEHAHALKEHWRPHGQDEGKRVAEGVCG